VRRLPGRATHLAILALLAALLPMQPTPARAEAPVPASAPVAARPHVAVQAVGTSGVVIDARTRQPIPGATITAGTRVFTADARGVFTLPADADSIGARAPGHRRVRLPRAQAHTVALEPFAARGLYLTVHGIGHRGLREGAFAAIQQAHLNAIVIDMKGDAGIVPYASGVATARAIGATKVRTVKDLPALLADLQRRGLYTIARIVVFKDAPYATAHPELAVRDARGNLWRDREGLAWIDPTRSEAWTYTLDIAEEVAKAGFDEIQFDYIRFPDERGLRFSRPLDEATRVAAIGGFLRAARTRLAPHNVFTSADIFGYVCWNTDDTAIGQQLEAMARLVDYLSPMLYPSCFQHGIPGVRAPLDDPYAIVARSLQRAAARTAGTGVRFRPWLQDFRDYAFDEREMTRAFLQAQIRAVDDSPATAGWMLWNPRNRYVPEAISPGDPR
jgi:hypothetical protein